MKTTRWPMMVLPLVGACALSACGGAKAPSPESTRSVGTGTSLHMQDGSGNWIALRARDGSDPRKPCPGSDKLGDPAAREAFLSSRAPTNLVVRDFHEYAQVLGGVFNVPLRCEGAVCGRPLSSPFPEFYTPTWRELLDAIARSSGSHWEYRADTGREMVVARKTEHGFETVSAKRDGFVFSEPSTPLPYQIKVAEGWRVEVRGDEIAYIPPIAPVGMDIYVWGVFSPEAPDEYRRLEAHFAGAFTKIMRPGTTADQMERRPVGGVDALFFSMPMGGKGNGTWRQWVFCGQGQCFAIVSAIDAGNEAALWPAVEEMVASFRIMTAP